MQFTTPSIPLDCIMQCAPSNTLLESSADHQAYVDALANIVLRKNPLQCSASLVAIEPSTMDDSSSPVFSELESATATADEPSMSNNEESGDTAPLNPLSEAQQLAALVRSKMTADEPLQDCLLSYSEDSHGGRSTSQDSVDLSIHASELIYINSILAHDEAFELEAKARLRKRQTWKSRMKKIALLLCKWRRKGDVVEK